jgi:hypothetical protein
MSIVNGVLSISQANVINTINIAGESVVVVDQFNFTKYGNGGSNTGSHTDTYSFYMASAGYVHITAISTFFTNSPPADVSETNFYVDGSFIGGRNGTGTLSTLPKVVIAKRYLTAGWHSGTAVHTYSSIEVNDVLNLTDVLILKAYR